MMSKDDNDVASACERKWKSAMMPQQVGNDAARIETSFGLSLVRRMKQQDPTGVGRWQLATSRRWCRKLSFETTNQVGSDAAVKLAWIRNQSRHDAARKTL
jgi:hypothetical protein